MKLRISIITSILILLFCNILVVNAEIESNYFSPNLKEGMVLEWKESIYFITPERENENYSWQFFNFQKIRIERVEIAG